VHESLSCAFLTCLNIFDRLSAADQLREDSAWVCCVFSLSCFISKTTTALHPAVRRRFPPDCFCL